MLFLLRNIRRKMLTENKVTTYLLYAIGEIFLVVVGILIAVQIDNWNEAQKEKESLNEYLIALKAEFKENQKRLEQVRKINQNNIHSAQKLSAIMGADTTEISKHDLRMLFINAIFNEVQYRPSLGVLEETISSGKLKLFGNDSLRYLLAGWSSDLNKIQFQEDEEVKKFRVHIMDFMAEKMNFRASAYQFQNNIFGLTPSRLRVDDYAVLLSIYLDNKIVNFISGSTYLEQRYAALDKKIARIIQKIDQIQTQR